MSYTVTLEALRKHRACVPGYNRLVAAIKGEAHNPTLRQWAKCDHSDPITIRYILDSNGLDDALWALRAVEGHDREIVLLADAYARRIKHPAEYPSREHCNDTEAAAWAAMDAMDAASWVAIEAANDATAAAIDAAPWAVAGAAEEARSKEREAQHELLIKMLDGDS